MDSVHTLISFQLTEYCDWHDMTHHHKNEGCGQRGYDICSLAGGCWHLREEPWPLHTFILKMETAAFDSL
jgi:hypothetical protein